MSPHALVCIIPDASSFREMSLALRLSHDLLLYHRLDVQIILESDALGMMETNSFPSGNIIYIGHPSATFVHTNLNKKETSFEIRNSSLVLCGHVLDDPSIGNVPSCACMVDIVCKPYYPAAVFLHPHPQDSERKKSIMLFMLVNSTTALERAGRLFPIRTGIATPSWVVSSHLADKFGAAGICGAG